MQLEIDTEDFLITEDLFRKKIGNKSAELKNFWSTPHGLPAKSAFDFVEMLWREYGKTKK